MVEAIFSSESLCKKTDESEYLLAPDVILLLVQDGTARLLDMDESFYAVPAIGAMMLQQTLERGTAAAVQRVAARYGADREQVQADLAAFLRVLEKRGLILHVKSDQRRRPTTLSTLCFPCLASALKCVHLGSRSLQTQVWALLILARLSFRLFGWKRTIAAWQKHYNRDAHASEQVKSEIVCDVDETIRNVAAKHLLTIGCKERALCCWALLRAVGVPATLVLGINLFPLEGHCWCESGSLILSDYHDRCERFTPILKYA